MNVSAPIKIFAFVGLLAAVALAGGMTFLGREPMDTEPVSVVLPKKKQAGVIDAPKAAKRVAARADAAVGSRAAPKAPAAPAPKKAAAAPAPAPKAPAAKRPAADVDVDGVAANGLPNSIVAALRTHEVAVVALWGPGGKIDQLARDEAAAGATATGAAFVPLNVIASARAAEALTLKLNVVLRAPGVLIFMKPDVLANRLDGFRDRETVAQAVLDARP